MSNTAQRSFRVGEVSPRLHGRADTGAYAESLKTLRNAVVMPMGGIESRPGSGYCASSKSDGAAYLIPFVRDTGQEYVLELGNLYLRFWLDGALITFSAPTAWADSTAYTAGDLVSYSGTNYVCILAHTSVLATNRPSTGSSWETYWYAETGVILELPTPYTIAQVPAVQWADDGTTRRFFAHPSHRLRELIRIGATEWSFLQTAFDAGDALSAPTNLVVTGAVGSDATFTRYRVTAVAGLLESLPSNIDGWNKRPGPFSSGNQTPITLTWDAVSGASAYRIYTSWSSQPWQFKVEVTTTTHLDDFAGSGFYGQPPPGTDLALTDFTASTKYPGVLGVHQQRLLVSGQTVAPDVVYASRTANFDNFFPHVPMQDDDALSWRQVATLLNRVRYFAEVDETLFIFSERAEGLARGDSDGILRPGEINPRVFSHNGIAALPPLVVDTALLYVQARGGLVRAILPGEHRGLDLSLTATHLTRGYTITGWCYQQTPHSTVWMVRSDGALLSLTYERESRTVGWAKHDTDGTVEAICCLPENGRDTVYLLVNRTINSSTVRYVERFTNRNALTTSSIVCVDAAKTVTYSRPHSTLTLSAGSYAGGVHTFTATGSGGSGSFTSADVGRTGCVSKAGTVYRFTVSAYTGGTIVTVQFTIADGVLVDADAFTTGLWWYTSAIGLAHLNGESVSVRLDGVVDASPNNSAHTAVTVTGGIANFNQTTAYASAIVGLPFTVDVRTLDLETAQGKSVKEGGINVKRIGLWAEETGALWAGQRPPSTDAVGTAVGLRKLVLEDEDKQPLTAGTLKTGYAEVQIDGKWSNSGSIFIRHVDPTPMTLLAVIPFFESGR